MGWLGAGVDGIKVSGADRWKAGKMRQVKRKHKR